MHSYFLEMGSDRLYIEEAGLKTGPILVCLPGLGGGAWFFQELAENLKHHFRILSIDLPGTGNSLVPEEAGKDPGHIPATYGFSINRCVVTLSQFLNTFPASSINLLGHSMSTMIAMKINAVLSQPLRSLIFVGGIPKVREGIREKLNLRTFEIRERGMVGMGQKIVSGVFSRTFRQRHPEAIAIFSQQMEALSPFTYLKGIEELLAADTGDLVAKIKTPCLVLTGSEDQYAPPNLVKAFAASIGSQARYSELAGCGHLPFLESPLELCHEVRIFLEHGGNRDINL